MLMLLLSIESMLLFSKTLMVMKILLSIMTMLTLSTKMMIWSNDFDDNEFDVAVDDFVVVDAVVGKDDLDHVSVVNDDSVVTEDAFVGVFCDNNNAGVGIDHGDGDCGAVVVHDGEECDVVVVGGSGDVEVVVVGDSDDGPCFADVDDSDYVAGVHDDEADNEGEADKSLSNWMILMIIMLIC